MGVTGLLPVIKSVMDQVHVSKYAGKTAGVDACSWLYKGAYSCAADVVLGRDTDGYLNYCVQQIKLLQDNGVTPVFVFDGAPLPAKDKVNEARNRNRAIWRNKALRLLEDGGELSGEAVSAVNRALSVSNAMIMKFISVLRRMGVTFYVAPYEADAQLAFLSKAKLIDIVISEDSDCIPYGCKTILFKLSPDGWGSELKRRSLGANEELSFLGWSEEMFVQLCVLSGCDYCASVTGVGIVTAYKYVNSYRTPAKVLAALKKEKKDAVPADYRDSFLSAILTFRHHLIYDPRDSKLKMLNPLTLSEEILPLVDKQLLFLGNIELGNDVVASIARGEIHPATHESYAWKDAGAALLNEQKQQRQHQQHTLAERTSTRSLTSSETSSVTRSDVDVRECDSVSRCESRDSQDAPDNPEHAYPELYCEQNDNPQLTDQRRPSRHSVLRYEKPRPSSSSSWAHLDSLLGSSAHILNFRSPKVSDNFKPLSSLKPSARPQLGPPGMLAHEVREYENRPVRTQAKRVRDPVNRRRDERGSGFEGEVLCRVDITRPSSSAREDRDRDAGAGVGGSAEVTYGESDNPVLTAAKKPRLQGQQSCEAADFLTSNEPRLMRPTPFGCRSVVGGVGPATATRVARESTSVMSPTSSLSASPLPLRLPKFTLSYARATYAEAKWDRILERELDDEGVSLTADNSSSTTNGEGDHKSNTHDPTRASSQDAEDDGDDAASYSESRHSVDFSN